MRIWCSVSPIALTEYQLYNFISFSNKNNKETEKQFTILWYFQVILSWTYFVERCWDSEKWLYLACIKSCQNIFLRTKYETLKFCLYELWNIHFSLFLMHSFPLPVLVPTIWSWPRYLVASGFFTQSYAFL